MINPSSIRISNFNMISPDETQLDHKKLSALKTMVRWLELEPNEWLNFDPSRTNEHLDSLIDLLGSIMDNGEYDNWSEKIILNELRTEYLYSLNKKNGTI